MAQSFFYSGQCRRFLSQFIRIMSHFQVEFGKDSQGIIAYQTVPVYYGDPSRQTMAAITGGSENALPTVPSMAAYISGFDYDRDRLQDPTFIGKINIRERSYDSASNTWGNDQGNSFTIERPMPVPYKLTLKLDIWTSNKEQKLQILEQIGAIFNPDFEIQNTDNYLDWTSLSAIQLKSTVWTSRSIPQMNSDSIDIATMTFELPIWISMPAKVLRLGVVQKMVSSLYDANGNLADNLIDLPIEFLLSQRAMTPMNYGVVFYGNTLKLTRQTSIITETVDGTIVEPSSSVDSWKTLIDTYGLALQNGTSQVQLSQPSGGVVAGTVSYHPTDSSLLLFSTNLDSIPTNSFLPVNAIIDPFNMPVDTTFLNVSVGTRYLILNDIGSANTSAGNAPQAWGSLVAKENDIIEYDGTSWFVSFVAASATSVKYVSNLKSGLQFKWLPTNQMWTRAIEGRYDPEQWTIVLSTLK